MRITKTLLVFAILVPFLIIFKTFWSDSSLAWGDAPYFYPDNLKELFSKPLIWDIRGDGLGKPQALTLWLYLPTFLLGLLHQLFTLNSALLMRIVFYLPATLLSIVGAWVYLKNYTDNQIIRFLGTYLYIFNTYFILLIDGGQVGVALAYGLSPFAVYWMEKYLHEKSFRNYLKSLGVYFLLSNIDLRIFIIVLSFTLVKYLLERGAGKIVVYFRQITAVLLPIAIIDSFWLIPFLSQLTISSQQSQMETTESLISLLNSILLFQPHYPINEFGNISVAPFYFVLLPILLLAGLLICKPRELHYRRYLLFTLLFLIFVFLVKGGSPPFGWIYSGLIVNVPLGFAFRDSSKFFIPLILISSTMLTLSLNFLTFSLSKRLKIFFYIAVFLYLNILISPSLFGKMTGVLKYQKENEYKLIYRNLLSDNSFYRTLWFSEKPELAFGSWLHPALSANNLYKERPLASMIEGSYDLFYFLNNPQLKEWLKLLGVKYVFFPENERKKTWTAQEKTEREQFLRFVSEIPFLEKINWGVNIRSYSIHQAAPHIFGQKKALLIVGPEDIYTKLNPNINLSAQGFIFAEDGRVNFDELLKAPANSLVIIFNNRTEQDLTLTQVAGSLPDLSRLENPQWAIRKSAEYVKWKDELLRRSIRSYDFDFGKGIAFSSIKGEKLFVDSKIEKPGKYYLVVKAITSPDCLGIKVEFNNITKAVRQSNFSWILDGPFELTPGIQTIQLENLGGTAVVNLAGLIAEEDLKLARAKSTEFLRRFQSLDINKNLLKINSLLEDNFVSVDYQQLNPIRYNVNITDNVNWIIFSDRYDKNWVLSNQETNPSQPFYSMINGFLVNGHKHFKLELSSQKYADIGMIISILGLIAGLGYVIYHRNQKNLKK